MPPAFGKKQRSAHRPSKKVASFLINTKGSLKNIILDADGFRQAGSAE
jgi:hypothetical protein